MIPVPTDDRDWDDLSRSLSLRDKTWKGTGGRRSLTRFTQKALGLTNNLMVLGLKASRKLSPTLRLRVDVLWLSPVYKRPLLTRDMIFQTIMPLVPSLEPWKWKN